MAKDPLGNKITPGSKIFFNGMIFVVKEVNENRVFGSKQITGRNITGMKIPDSMILEAEVPGDFSQPINCYVVKDPDEDKTLAGKA